MASGVPGNAVRIIPARAGFTLSRRFSRVNPADHPRSRGVYVVFTFRAWGVRGSSPLARGLRGCELREDDGRGIIPARAGFTASDALSDDAHWDHPRSRGVYWARSPIWRRSRGSSPLARGLQRTDVQGVRGEGIIPARAGFTAGSRHALGCLPDHPRSRGVYSGVHLGSFRLVGSSPLARGLPLSGSVGCSSHGIIPARAGFTTLEKM